MQPPQAILPFAVIDAIPTLLDQLDRESYIADPAIATSLHLAIQLRKPLLVEGHAGVGKTEIAKVLARMLGTDPEELGAELRRLKMRCRKLVWLNPLLGSPDYQPLTQGMQAALPHLDVFAPAHNLASLRALERHFL
jgi:MoxR-like ATPase